MAEAKNASKAWNGLIMVSVGQDFGLRRDGRLDLKYINDWSLWLDMKILLKAILYVLLGKNY